MTGILRATFVAAFVTASLPRVAVAQNASADSLLRRIEVLERTTIDLQLRVRDLETLVKSEPARAQRAPASSNSRDLQNWRQLRRGMTMDEVRALLGEPDRVDALGGITTIWNWKSGGASVRFDGSDKLDGWSEPRG